MSDGEWTCHGCGEQMEYPWKTHWHGTGEYIGGREIERGFRYCLYCEAKRKLLGKDPREHEQGEISNGLWLKLP